MKRDTDWPRYLKRRSRADGTAAFYWIPHERDIAGGFTLHSESLGPSFEAAAARARLLNEHLDAWRENKALPVAIRQKVGVGTIDWWRDEFLASDAVKRLGQRTRDDYAEALARIADLPTKMIGTDGVALRMGTLMTSSISMAAADKIYVLLRDGGITRQADAAIDVARRAWKVVARAHPAHFLIPVTGADGRMTQQPINPFASLERANYERDTARPASREQTYALADQLAKAGHPALGVGCLICFEWMQRPEDVRMGRLTWTDYRPGQRPTEVLVFHHKTRARVWQPLVFTDPDGVTRALYPEIEAHLATLERLGTPIVMFRPQRGPKDLSGNRTPRLYSEPYAQHLVQAARASAGLPAHVTLEACRHGGMTELGDSGLTEQEIMSLSGHTTPRAARLYVKRTATQRMSAAVKRRNAIEGKR